VHLTVAGRIEKDGLFAPCQSFAQIDMGDKVGLPLLILCCLAIDLDLDFLWSDVFGVCDRSDGQCHSTAQRCRDQLQGASVGAGRIVAPIYL